MSPLPLLPEAGIHKGLGTGTSTHTQNGPDRLDEKGVLHSKQKLVRRICGQYKASQGVWFGSA
jgi:hypothetical protein